LQCRQADEKVFRKEDMSVKQLFDLSGRVALISGGSRGLGLQMAEALGEMGAKIAISARKQKELDAAVAHLAGLGIEAAAFAADLGQIETGPALADAVMAHFGQIDILINNAGIAWAEPAEDHSMAGWTKTMNLNVNGLWSLTQAVGKKAMIPRKKGRIINIASISGLRGQRPDYQRTIAYNTSKGAVVNLTRALAAEWGEYGITVNCIAPGPFVTTMAASTIESGKELLMEMTPLKKTGGPEDLKGAALLFASDACDYISGQVLAVDGGITAM
jgi:NAD(P)-dependent dehydrogenase (short-subunit alcohol dehydrogenase family)